MKHYLKVWFRMGLTHISVQVCTLMLGTATLGFILDETWGGLLLSVLASGFYMGFIYRNAWHTAKLDIKPYSVNKAYTFKGLILVLPILTVTLVLAIVWMYTSPTMLELRDTTAFAMSMMLDGWNFNAHGFIDAQAGNLGVLYWIAIFAFCPIASILGYIAGMRKYSVVDKVLYPMVYKKRKPGSGE